MRDIRTMNKSTFFSLAVPCAAFAAVVATGGDALVYVQGLVASLPF